MVKYQVPGSPETGSGQESKDMNESAETRVAQLPVAVGSAEQFYQMAYSLPVLSAEEERELAQRHFENGDVEAARALVLHNLRFVLHIARGYGGYGLPLADLVQEGSIGLMKAVKRFDPSVGVRFISFAVHWVRSEIHEYVLRNWRIVKIATTKSQRKLFFNLRKAKKRLGWMNDREVDAVAEDLGVTPREVREMELRMSQPDMALDLEPDHGDGPAPRLSLPAPQADPAQLWEEQDSDENRSQQLHEAMQGLDERSRNIVRQRWLGEKKRTLQDLADEYGLSAERVRQIEATAFQKLRQTVS